MYLISTPETASWNAYVFNQICWQCSSIKHFNKFSCSHVFILMRIWCASKKWRVFARITSVTAPHFYYKWSSRRQRCCSWISVSEAVQHFRNLRVYETGILLKKPSSLWPNCAANTFGKRSEHRSIIFLDAYHVFVVDDILSFMVIGIQKVQKKTASPFKLQLSVFSVSIVEW